MMFARFVIIQYNHFSSIVIFPLIVFLSVERNDNNLSVIKNFKHITKTLFCKIQHKSRRFFFGKSLSWTSAVLRSGRGHDAKMERSEKDLKRCQQQVSINNM